jgi:hypothetical protein
MSTCSTVRSGGALGADAQPTNRSGNNKGRKRIMKIIRVNRLIGRQKISLMIKRI